MSKIRMVIKKFKTFIRLLYNLLYYFVYKKKAIVLTGYIGSWGNEVIPNNFGDDINYIIVKFLSNNNKVINIHSNILFSKKIKALNYACIGSIVDKFLNKKTIVWGSGSARGCFVTSEIPDKVLSVRGPLTRKVFLDKGIECPEIYGDPALLLPYIFECKNVKKTYKWGIIPNTVDSDLQNLRLCKEKYGNDVIIIDLQHYNKWEDIVVQINKCEHIFSSSLHGLIVADAYGISNTWIKLSDRIIGGNFKFMDYLASVHRIQNQPLDLVDKEIVFDTINYKATYEPISIDIEKMIRVCPFLSKERYLYIVKKGFSRT